MKVSEEMMYIRCLAIEALVKGMVLKGITDTESLVEAVNNMFLPDTTDEMERYSEAIIYAKYSILN
jgi:hypothetical protein